MKAYIFITLLFFSTNIFSQQNGERIIIKGNDTIFVTDPFHSDKDTTVITNKDGSKSTFVYMERMPHAPYDIQAYVNKNKQIPKELDTSKRNKVVVKFLVLKNGSIDSISIVQSGSSNAAIEALRLVRTMPPWIPGKLHGKTVDAWYTMPIIFNRK